MNKKKFLMEQNEESYMVTALDIDDELPDSIILRSGSVIDPRSMEWKFVDGVTYVSMNFHKLPPSICMLIPKLKRVLIQVLEKYSPSYASVLFQTFKKFAKIITDDEIEKISRIEEVHISNFISTIPLDDKTGVEFQLSALLTCWNRSQVGGISDAAIRLIHARKKQRRTKGKPVMTLDPVSGPLMDYELQQLIIYLNNAYASGKIDDLFFNLAWLSIVTGQRVSQYCALKVKDLVKSQNEFGDIVYEIMIPRAKQSGETTRDSFLSRPLVHQFGERLWNYCENVRSVFPKFGDDAPMFPSSVKRKKKVQINAVFEGHWDATAMSFAFQEALVDIVPVTPRTKQKMNIGTHRLRYTLGTRLAQEGFGELVIAEALGHADTQNVGVYTAATPEIADRLDKKLARELAPIANAFLGSILIRPEDATFSKDMNSQIVDYRYAKSGVGNCGTRSECKFNAPIACYTCRNFEAWLDAPHEKLLDHLIADRDRLMETSGPRVAAVNDLTIIAIQRVVDECARIKSAVQK